MCNRWRRTGRERLVFGEFDLMNVLSFNSGYTYMVVLEADTVKR